MLTAELLRELLAYDPETGSFWWRVSRGNRAAGSGAASENFRCLSIKINGRNHKAHRLAWLYVHGEWPAGVIDHIDGNWRNNRLANLRDVTQLVNCQNRRTATRNNWAGLLGVRARKYGFDARIVVSGKSIYLGGFKTAEEAHTAYLQAKRQLHEGNTL